MFTLTRVGQTSIYAETSLNDANHGSMGFFVPGNVPHLPTQLSASDIWNFGISSSGAGWCLFTPKGQGIPTDTATANALASMLRGKLPTSSPQTTVGFVWLDGDMRQPATLTVQYLALLQPNTRRGQPNPYTPAYPQTLTFKQFSIVIQGGTEVKLKAGAAGFDILHGARAKSFNLRLPIAPQQYTAATTGSVQFEGELRGSLQFTLEPMLADKFGYGGFDASLYYYLRPENGSGQPRRLRYPIIDETRVNSPLSFQVAFFPTTPTSSFFTVVPQSNGSPTPIPSYFRTTSGYPVDLLGNTTAKGRFYMRPRSNPNNEVTDMPEIYYFTPNGGFEIFAGGPLDENSMTALLTGASGTEYVRMRPRNGTAGDLLRFEFDRSAYAQTFGDLEMGGSALLTPDYRTSWVTVEGVGNPSDRFYYAQPPNAPLFQANGIFDGTPYLDYSEASIATIKTTFPMTPVAGINIEPYVNTIDVDTYELFERDVLVPTRDETMKRASTTLPASPARSMRSLLANGNDVEKRTTPQGLIVDVDIATNRYQRVLLGRVDETEMAVDSPTELFQQALATNKLFLVITHLGNVGDFTDNAITLSSWNFVADIAAEAEPVRSIMVMKYADGSTVNQLVDDTSQWRDPDNFTDAVTISAKLKSIIADMRTKAGGAGSGTSSTDADVAKYYQTMLDTVIDAPNWSGIIVFEASLGNPNEMPREILGLLPGMVVTKPTAAVDGGDLIAATNMMDPDFKAHHLRIDIAKVKQDGANNIIGIENSSMSALIDYENANAATTGASRWTDNSKTAIEVDDIADITDFSYRVKFMRVIFENSYIKNFISDVTLNIHKLFKEVPDISELSDGSMSVNAIDLSGSLQQIDGIPTYVFRFGCIDPLLNNFIVCSEKGLGNTRAIVKFPAVSPVITAIESTRVDYNMLQAAQDIGQTNIAEFVIAGFLQTRELGGRDFFSYDRVGFGKLPMTLQYTMLDEEDMTDDIAKPEDMGNPFWIFSPNKMRFDTVRGQTRDGSVVKAAPLALKGIAESVSSFSAADASVFPIPNLVPMSSAMIPYQPSSTAILDPSPVTYIISYGFSTAGIGLSISAGGLMDITVHTGWKEATWTDSGEGVFYTALQWATPLSGLDIGKSGMFKAELNDFGFGEVPTSSNDRLFFIYVNSLALTIMKWTAKVSLLLFAPVPGDEGFAGAFGNGGANISSWFGSFSLTKGSSGTSSVNSLPVPIVVPAKPGDPEFVLANAAIRLVIQRKTSGEPEKYELVVHGYVQNVGGINGASTITVTTRLFDGGMIRSGDSPKSTTISFASGGLKSSEKFEISYGQSNWPGSDTQIAANVQITGDFITSSRSKRIRQTNTVSLRADEGKPGRSGSPIIEIDYIAIGRGVRMRRGTAADGDSNLNVRPEMRTVGDALEVMQQMLPSGESGPDLYDVLRDIYAPDAGMMVGIDISIMGWLRLAVIANTADEVYGGLVEVKDGAPGFAQILKGLRIEILYRRLWDDSDLGVYEGTLILPDSLRYWDVGGFSITLPVISLAVYTDGGFFLDLGFPSGSFASGYDYSRSFAIQGFVGPFPVMGAVGLYLGRLSADAEYTIPDIDPTFGVWKSAWKFGLAAKIGFGKAYKRGPVSFELSLTAQLALQGVASAIDRVSSTDDDSAWKPAPADYLMLEASFNLVLLAMGKFEVRAAGFGLSATLNVKASLGISFRYMTAVPIKIQLSIVLEAELRVSLELLFFSISISFKFIFKFQPSFSIDTGEHPDWIQWATGYPPKSVNKGDNVLTTSFDNPIGLRATGRALAAGGLTWSAPGAMWDSTFDSVFTYTSGSDTVDLRDDDGKLPIDRVFATPFTIDEDGNLVAAAGLVISELHARFLQAGIFAWAAKTVLGSSVNGSTTLSAGDLVTLRAAIDGERDALDYSTLRDFLDANYTFNIHPPTSAETYLKPAGSSETVASVYPMDPGYSLSYDDTTVVFADQTLRDSSYYNNLDAYLGALLLKIEQQLGLSDGASALDAPVIPTRPLVTHVFEAYYGLILEAGVENAIEAKVSRADDSTEITDTWTLAQIIGDIIDRTHPAAVSAVTGLTSRLMLGGHQLPDSFDTSTTPPMPSSFQPLYALTGQQIPVSLTLPEPDEEEEEEPDDSDVIWTLTLLDGDDELAAANVTRGDYAALTALPDDVQDAIDFDADEPVIERIKPYLEQDPSYPIDERIRVASAGGDAWASSLMPFSKPVLARLEAEDDTTRLSSSITKVVYDDEFSNEIESTLTLLSSQYNWALIVPITAGRVVDAMASTTDENGSTTTVFSKSTYTFGGTDELTRGRVAGLMTDLMEGNPSITGVSVLHSTSIDEVGGLAGLDSTARILKTNLSTVSAPRSGRRLAAVDPPEEKFYGDLTSADIFASLRLLWEASVVNAPGFFLEYDGEDGIPDDAFGATNTADLTLVIKLSSSQGIPAYANGIVYSSTPSKVERFYLTSNDAAAKIAIPTGVPGTLAFYAGRDVSDASAGSLARGTATLFNLLAYRIKDKGGKAGNWAVSDESWSMPFSPLKLNADLLPSSISSLEWNYEVVVPWTTFLTSGRTASPLVSETAAYSPYDIIGNSVYLELAALDTFGNIYPTTVEKQFEMKYTDPLISLPEWAEAKIAYQVNASGQIVMVLEFGSDRFTAPETVARARALRVQYETIWFQLNDANTTISLNTTLLNGNGSIGLANGHSINAELQDWVEEVLDFLNAKVTGGTASEPSMKVLTTTAISRSTRDQQPENIHPLQVTITMSRPESMVDTDAAEKLTAIASVTSSIKPDTQVEADLPALPEGMSAMASESLVGFAQKFEKAFPEMRLGTGDSDTNDQALWMVRMGPGVSDTGTGIQYLINTSERSYFGAAPLSTRLETVTIVDPEDTSKTVPFSNVDMDKLARRFIAVVDTMLTEQQAVDLRRADAGKFARILRAKETLASGIPNGLLAIYTGDDDADRQASSREVYRQTLLKSLSAAYDVDTVLSYNASVNNSESITGTPPNLYGTVVALESPDGEEAAYVVGTAKIKLGGDSHLSFTFSTSRDSERAQLPTRMAYQVTYVEHNIQTDKPAWAPPSGSYEYRSSSWLKLILPDNPSVLDSDKLVHDPVKLFDGNTPVNIPIPLREFPVTPAILRQFGNPETAAGESVTLEKAAAWEYEFQVERARAAQDRIYLQIAFNKKQALRALLADEDTLLHALCRFDLLYSRLMDADKPIAEQTQPTAAELLTLTDAIEAVANTWGTWEPNVPIQEYTWLKDDWAYHMSETIAYPDSESPVVSIRLQPLAIKEPIGGKNYGDYPQIRVPDPITSGPVDLYHHPESASPGDPVTYSFTWSGTVPDNQTRSFVFSDLNVLKTENARGRIWLTRNENLGDLDGRTTNERFIYRSGASEFTDPLQPYIDRTVPVDIKASVTPTQQSLAGYLQAVFQQVFNVAIDNGYPWPLTKINCRYGHDPRNKAMPVEGPGMDDQFFVYLPVLDHVPFVPTSAADLANEIASIIQTWEAHIDIPNSPTKGTGFYEFDLSVFSTLGDANGAPVLRLRRMWIARFD
ncbi:MAG: hypothetical protein M9890_09650 [Thermomicrobiales bacterium]|nr:hypothetical protein [Thermomicrobiales bacterium]